MPSLSIKTRTNIEHITGFPRFKGQMSVSAPPTAISELRERIARLEGGNARARTVLPFGVAAIDRVLPGGGLAFGGLHEVAGGGNGAVDGAAAALFAAGIAARMPSTRKTRFDLVATQLTNEPGLASLPGRYALAGRSPQRSSCPTGRASRCGPCPRSSCKAYAALRSKSFRRPAVPKCRNSPDRHP